MIWHAASRQNPHPGMTTDKRGTPSPLPHYLHAAFMAHAQVIHQRTSLPWTLDNDIFARELDPSPRDVVETSSKRIAKMLEGIEAWQNSPSAPQPPQRKTIWQHGPVRLLDLGGTGVRTLVIPSLINRSTILDLSEDISFVGQLQSGGLSPVLLDWGTPDAMTRALDLGDLVSQVLIPALHFLHGQSGGPISVLGYCMGGTLALGLSARAPSIVARLALIGAPWDFSDLRGVSLQLRGQIAQHGIANVRTYIRQIGHIFGAVPGDLFQYLFAMLAPMQGVQKFSRFPNLVPGSAHYRHFCAVEEWVNDSVPVSAPATEDLLINMYCENATATGKWQINGQPVHLSQLSCPTLTLAGARDHIVPARLSPETAQLPEGSRSKCFDAGHVGMVAGRAHADVAYRVCEFLGQKNIS